MAGAIAIPLGYASREGLYKQMANAMPLVFLDARVDAPGVFVGTDNRQSVDLIVDYLLRSGSPPSYFDMPDVNQNARERRQSYETSMQERGAEPKVFALQTRDWDFERVAFEETSRLIKSAAFRRQHDPLRQRSHRFRRDGRHVRVGHGDRSTVRRAGRRPRRSPVEPVHLPAADDRRARRRATGDREFWRGSCKRSPKAPTPTRATNSKRN